MPIAETQQQELTSAWIFKRALNDNKKYTKWEDILADPKFQKEVIGTSSKPGIYPNVTETWLRNYYAQQNTFIKEFSDSKFSEFSRDGGFMKYISELVKRKFGISNTDTWNPTDIWCVKDENSVIRDIDKAINDKSMDSIEKLNVLLRTMYKERRVVGISLKYIKDKRDYAFYEEFNINDEFEFAKSEKPRVEIDQVRLDLKFNSSKKKYEAEGCSIWVLINKYNKQFKYTMETRTVSSSRWNNLSSSFIAIPNSGGQEGRAPNEMVLSEMKKYGLTFQNDHNAYPKSIAEFNERLDEFKKKFQLVSKKKFVLYPVTEEEFIKGIRECFLVKPPIANSKLMQLTMYSEFAKLKTKEFEEIMTSLLFFAQKKGKGFGPFGKLY